MTKLFDINKHGVSQLINSPNQWAKELWKKGCANNWSPSEINMSVDIKQWKDKILITSEERLLVKRTLGLFAMGESLVNNSIASVENIYITDGACRQYMGRKAFEETLHNWTVEVCCEAYNLDVKDVAEAYLNIPSIKNKNQFLFKSLNEFGADFKIDTIEGKKQFVRNMAVFYLICEGVWFFSNFALVMSLGRQNKLTGLYDQINYTVRDESTHIEYGINIINKTRKEYPEIWKDGKLEKEIVNLMKEGAEIEFLYAKDILPEGILGVTYEMLVQYIKFLADMRLNSIGIESIFSNPPNPFSWLGEAQDAKGMTAFFERREKNYQQSGSLTDDF